MLITLTNKGELLDTEALAGIELVAALLTDEDGDPRESANFAWNYSLRMPGVTISELQRSVADLLRTNQLQRILKSGELGQRHMSGLVCFRHRPPGVPHGKGVVQIVLFPEILEIAQKYQ